MTASVSGYSIMQGFASTLDTMLPSAWTSTQPQLVGLWSQRMGKLVTAGAYPSATKLYSLTSCGDGRMSLRTFSSFDCVFDTDVPLQPILLIWFNSEAILLGLKQEPEVASLAATYLK